MDDEYLDLVDETDNVIGREKRDVIYSKNLKNYRAVNLFIRNSKGQLWIPRRTATKKIFPLGLDMSMGGHVESGESYDKTLKREAEEELRMDIREYKVKLLGTLNPYKDNIGCFMQVYELESDEAPDYNKDDFCEYYWLYPQEILLKIANGDRSKDHLPILIRKFYINPR